ncbi:hypothetical protein [Saccharopolyspora sp. NPDC002376]
MVLALHQPPVEIGLSFVDAIPLTNPEALVELLQPSRPNSASTRIADRSCWTAVHPEWPCTTSTTTAP